MKIFHIEKSEKFCKFCAIKEFKFNGICHLYSRAGEFPTNKRELHEFTKAKDCTNFLNFASPPVFFVNHYIHQFKFKRHYSKFPEDFI